MQDISEDVVECDVDPGLGHLHRHEPLPIIVELQLLRIRPADISPPCLGPTSAGQELNRAAPRKAIESFRMFDSLK